MPNYDIKWARDMKLVDLIHFQRDSSEASIFSSRRNDLRYWAAIAARTALNRPTSAGYTPETFTLDLVRASMIRHS